MNIILDWSGERVTRAINFKLIMDSKFVKIKKKTAGLLHVSMYITRNINIECNKLL